MAAEGVPDLRHLGRRARLRRPARRRLVVRLRPARPGDGGLPRRSRRHRPRAAFRRRPHRLRHLPRPARRPARQLPLRGPPADPQRRLRFPHRLRAAAHGAALFDRQGLRELPGAPRAVSGLHGPEHRADARGAEARHDDSARHARRRRDDDPAARRGRAREAPGLRALPEVPGDLSGRDAEAPRRRGARDRRDEGPARLPEVPRLHDEGVRAGVPHHARRHGAPGRRGLLPLRDPLVHDARDGAESDPRARPRRAQGDPRRDGEGDRVDRLPGHFRRFPPVPAHRSALLREDARGAPDAGELHRQADGRQVAEPVRAPAAPALRRHGGAAVAGAEVHLRALLGLAEGLDRAGLVLGQHLRARQAAALQPRGADLPRGGAGAPPAGRPGRGGRRRPSLPALQLPLGLRRRLGPLLGVPRQRGGLLHRIRTAGSATSATAPGAPAGWWSTPASTSSAGRRQQAIDFLAENTSLPLVEATTETDRYISWPGQALSYYLGYLKIRELRTRAEQALGERFDVRAFHDEVLRHGSVPLPVLESIIDSWIAGRKSAG